MLSSIVDGLIASPAVLCLALAYGVIYGILGLMDLTLATRFATAGYTAWVAANMLRLEGHLPTHPVLWFSALLGVCSVTTVTWFALASVARRNSLSLLVGSLGLSYLIQAACQAVFGAAPKVFTAFPAEEGVPFLGTSATRLELLMAGYAVIAIAVAAALLRATTLGAKLRLVAQDPELGHAVFGINERRLTWTAVLLASCLLAPAGLLYAIGHGVGPATGLQQGLLALVATIVAGRHRPLAAVVTALGLVVMGTIAIRWTVAELLLFWAVLGGLLVALRTLWCRWGTPVRVVGISVLVLACLFVAETLASAFHELGAGGAADLRLPSAYQPAVPYAIVLAALLWRPRGVLAQIAARPV